MKKYIYIILAAIMIAAGACTKTKQTQLRMKIEQFNKQCPASLGAAGTLESVGYDTDSNSATFTYELNEDNVSVAGLADVDQEQKAFLANFLRSNDFGKSFLNDLVEAEASLRLIYRGAESRDSVSVTLTTAELKEIAAEEIGDDTDRLQLESMLAITNKQCPMNIDEGLVLESVTAVDNFLVYTYSYDTEIYDFANADLDGIREESTNALRDELTDISGRTQLKLMKDCGMGVKYTYHPEGARDSAVTVTIQPETIAAF
ncbi:MAG: hypothetical protein NC418_11425 [Muribaculaceae bacterium]|nr:hypothetical protein [Muribaculaceae bacterium]